MNDRFVLIILDLILSFSLYASVMYCAFQLIQKSHQPIVKMIIFFLGFVLIAYSSLLAVIAYQSPEMFRLGNFVPLEILFNGDLLPIWAARIFIVLVVFAIVFPHSFYYRKIHSGQQKDREEIKKLKAKASSANCRATKESQRSKKIQKKLKKIENGYAFIMASPNVPQNIKNKFFEICRE